MKFYDNRFDFLFDSSADESTDMFTENVVNGSTAYDVSTGDFYIYYNEQWHKQDFEDSGSESDPV